jgi:TolA-binding protein
MGYGRARVTWRDEIHDVAAAVLANALESAYCGEAGGRSTYGNQWGRELLEERHDMKERMKRLEDKVTSLQHNVTDLQHNVTDLQRQNTCRQNENADLQRHVKDLKLASEGYRKIRNRFINVYRRDVLGHMTHQEHQQIGDGNNAAHGGDAVADASLYTSGERRDEGVLIQLYGLSASQISYHGKC